MHGHRMLTERSLYSLTTSIFLQHPDLVTHRVYRPVSHLPLRTFRLILRSAYNIFRTFSEPTENVSELNEQRWMTKPLIRLQSGAVGGLWYMRSAGFMLLGKHPARRIVRIWPKPRILPHLPSGIGFRQRHVLDISSDGGRTKIHITPMHWPVCNRLESVWPKPALT